MWKEQEFEYVEEEMKIKHLLKCLLKTAPPVLIFCEKKADVDAIHEYLLREVAAVAIHGGMDQEEREYAISSFLRQARKTSLLPPIFGPTGRCGNTGVATAFVNKNQSETTILDLKHLLLEAKQRIPPMLAKLYNPMGDADTFTNASRVKGCAWSPDP
ncbi:Helicase, C-terminal [Parasponia andersonii]|uniref:Helicase, C-terminal n=1 Tax=Parasponia andersonii TaxID=3476 RepID=A0A2P5BDV8_PARAD|nr:Helicase, C-terminal [Parasponia andersonii]